MKILILAGLTFFKWIRQTVIFEKLKMTIMKTNEGLLRKKLLGISVLFHLSLIIVALTTYFTVYSAKTIETVDSYNYMEINFTNNSTSSGLASIRKNVENKPVEKPTPRAIETKTIKVEALEELENEIATSKEETLDKTINENTENITSKTEGEGKEGLMLSGKALGELDFDGDGIFGRKVIYHPPIKKLAEQNGRIAINMGINRAGKVVAIALNKDYSTIDNKELIRRALKMAAKYKFEHDYTAPYIQYGRFTLIFNIKM